MDTRVLQIWFDVIIYILAKPLLEYDMGLDLRGELRKVDKWNAWYWWKAKKCSIHFM